MAITLNGATADLKGLSSDEKPTDVSVNTLFLELDTGCFFYFTGTVWAEVGGASNG